MSDEKERTIRILPFSGKKEHWAVWGEKFLARAKRKGYKGILLGKHKAPRDSDPYDTSPELQALRDANELGFEELILSIDGKTKEGRVAFSLVKGCKDADFADGNAHLAWTRLSKKYASKNTVSLLKLKREFTNSVMKSKQDPDEWITELEELQTRIADIANGKAGVEVSDEDMMIHVLNYLPREYDIERHDCEKELGASTLNMTKLREALGSRYAIEYDKDDENLDEDNQEKALFAKQFKGKCNYCGKWGHKAADCNEKKKAEAGGRGRASGC